MVWYGKLWYGIIGMVWLHVVYVTLWTLVDLVLRVSEIRCELTTYKYSI